LGMEAGAGRQRWQLRMGRMGAAAGWRCGHVAAARVAQASAAAFRRRAG